MSQERVEKPINPCYNNGIGCCNRIAEPVNCHTYCKKYAEYTKQLKDYNYSISLYKYKTGLLARPALTGYRGMRQKFKKGE